MIRPSLIFQIQDTFYAERTRREQHLLQAFLQGHSLWYMQPHRLLLFFDHLRQFVGLCFQSYIQEKNNLYK